ncbi:DUF4184 family protein [Arsenicicoccus sp. oral taxon 190]|uniref:DUF4184 family protein n=1 Tax=Arsenicicoccus sp. oral taxon 190 TaxID=1658671 RepID=UPI00067A0320|nr:DUF4184 family protein [Arsenicicoccus sp. oral taxon 190]AKT50501.1 hypothetical protein ADJ73_02785 [Arsenicicoccus sp. oral taxon 190]
MPFTLAHPAFALPLRRLGLPVAALAAGSMAPDLPLYAAAVGPVPVAGRYAHTHSAVGIVTLDLALGLALWAVWEWLLRAPVHDALPDAVRRRAHALVGPGPRGPVAGLTVVLAVVLGAASHVGVDELTHPGRWGATHVSWLAQTHLGLPGTAWLQLAGGAGGLLVLGAVTALGWWRSPVVERPRRCPAYAPWIARAAALATGVVVSAATVAAVAGVGTHQVAYHVATLGVLLMGGVLLVAAVGWHLARARAEAAEQPSET